MITEIKLVETMEQGLIISISFALGVLLFATGNILMAMISALSIGLIIVNLTAIVDYNNWVLGAAESVAIVSCVGFSVDYVVHLASHFVHSKHDTREERMKEALEELGISILAGSITTMLATAPLPLCILMVFRKFGVFVIATIGFSIFYSLAFFSSLCLICGPEGKCCDIVTTYEILKHFYQKQ